MQLPTHSQFRELTDELRAIRRAIEHRNQVAIHLTQSHHFVPPIGKERRMLGHVPGQWNSHRLLAGHPGKGNRHAVQFDHIGREIAVQQPHRQQLRVFRRLQRIVVRFPAEALAGLLAELLEGHGGGEVFQQHQHRVLEQCPVRGQAHAAGCAERYRRFVVHVDFGLPLRRDGACPGGNVQPADELRVHRPIRRQGAPAQQRFTEHAVPQEVHVLLGLDLVRRQHAQGLLDLRAEVAGDHGAEACLAEVLQTFVARHLRELVEVHRLVHFLQVFVKQVMVLLGADVLQFGFQQQGIRPLLGHGTRHEIEQCPGLLDAFLRLGEPPGVVAHHVADHAAHVPAGIRVVRDVCDAVGAELLAAEVEDFFADVGRYPGKHSVGDDVVERAVRGIEIEDVGLLQRDVLQAEFRDNTLAFLDLLAGEVDAHELAIGQVVRSGDDVAARSAGDLQYPAALHRRWPDAEERTQCEQPRRMRLRERHAFVGNFVVTLFDGVHGRDGRRSCWHCGKQIVRHRASSFYASWSLNSLYSKESTSASQLASMMFSLTPTVPHTLPSSRLSMTTRTRAAVPSLALTTRTL